MQNVNYESHLVMFYNIPYNCSNEDFYQYAIQFGEISKFEPQINKHGICFVLYYDIRCSRQAILDTTNNSNNFMAQYAICPFFPMEKMSSKISVSYKDNRLIKLIELVQIFSEYGEIQQSALISPQKAEITFFDSRSSNKACSLTNDEIEIKLIFNTDQNQSNSFINLTRDIDEENQIKILKKKLSMCEKENINLKDRKNYA